MTMYQGQNKVSASGAKTKIMQCNSELHAATILLIIVLHGLEVIIKK